jgi:hypothetical protein
MLSAFRKISTMGLAVTAAAVGIALSGATPAIAATNPTNFVGGPQTSHSGCGVGLMYSRLSSSTPADVAAETYDLEAGHTCTAWVERSPTGKTTWTQASAKVPVPSVAGLEAIANTGVVYDGPGYKARACVQAAKSSAVYCTSAVSLAKGSGTATSPAFPASYVLGNTGAEAIRGNSGGTATCFGTLASSTTTKKTGTSVIGLLDSEGDPCTGWIQTSANKGKTWTTVSPLVSFKSPNDNTDVLAFMAHYADKPGHLARICVKDMTNKQTNCGASW